MPSYFTVFMQCCAPECVRSSAYTLMLIPIRYHYVKTVAEFGIGTMVHTLLIFKISDEKVIDRVESVSEESGNEFFLSCLWLFGVLLKTEHMGKPWNN